MTETASIPTFVFGKLSTRLRFSLALLAFFGGVACALLASRLLLAVGLILIGHGLIWVRKLKTAPGGATPADVETWAPVEDDWLVRLRELESKGRKWDLSPWDASNAIGCVAFVGIGVALFGLIAVVAGSSDRAGELAVLAMVLFAPVWLNGMRSNWIPSELRLKGDALQVAIDALERAKPGAYDVVPLLAMREGRRGRYPTDARVMFRPKGWGAEDFLGIQVQVALNNVQGTDFPYLYFVLLMKKGGHLPRSAAKASDIEVERGSGDDVVYLVVRQHADRSGGWETEPHQIAALLDCVLTLADSLR